MARTKNNGDMEQSTSSPKTRETRSTTSPFTRGRKNLATPRCASPSSNSDDPEIDTKTDTKSKVKRGRASRRQPRLVLDEAGKSTEDNDAEKKGPDNLKAGTDVHDETSSTAGELKNGENNAEVCIKDVKVEVCKLNNMNGSTSAEDVTDGTVRGNLNGKLNDGEHVLLDAEGQNGTAGKVDGLASTDVDENGTASTIKATKAECDGNKEADKSENESTEKDENKDLKNEAAQEDKNQDLEIEGAKKDKNQALENKATKKDENQDEVESVDEIGLVLPESSFEETVSNGKKRKFYIEEMTDEDLLPRKKIKENDTKKRRCSIM